MKSLRVWKAGLSGATLLFVACFGFAVTALASTPPHVNKVWSWNVTDKTAGLSLEVVNLQVATSVHFVYGTDASLAGGTTVGQGSVGPGPSGSHAHATLGNLTPNTTYYFKGVASNQYGSTSASGSFKTGGASGPAITKIWHWNVSTTMAGLSMSLTNGGVPCQSSFSYGTDPGLAGAARTREQTVSGYEGGIQSHGELTGLQPGTKYYYRAQCSNAYGPGQGAEIQSFTTVAM